MKQLTIQILLESAWVDVATLTPLQPELGNASPTRLGYELDYALYCLVEILGFIRDRLSANS